MADLSTYNAKRDFDATPEPGDLGAASKLGLRYSIQKHRARRLHWDLRLEWGGVLLSWAITRGPSFDPAQKRLAVRTEDHPLSYLRFEGEIPANNYGAGTVMLWDIGYWKPLTPANEALSQGRLKLRLHGRRVTGDWTLVRMRGKGEAHENWLLMKTEDEAAYQSDPVRRYTRSVASGRGMDQIAKNAAPVTPDRKGARPKHVAPQLALLVEDLADPKTYWHELKFDGYRLMAALGIGGTRLYTRNSHDWTDRFAEILPAFDDLACDAALIDGEVIAGASLNGFSALQNAISLGGPFRFIGFDILSLNGEDLRTKPLKDRRHALERVFKPVPPLGPIQLSPIIDGPADDILGDICSAGGEGLIAKPRNAPYRSGRGAWLKIKCRHRAEFVIIGWQPSQSRGRPFASLLLAARERGSLRYVGKVGTGFDGPTMTMIANALEPLKRKTPPASAPKSEVAGAQWIDPHLVAEVEFAEMTAQDRVRHAVFLGLRNDKPSDQVSIERSTSMSDPTIAGVTITNPDRVIFPGAKLTKSDLARYYAAIAPAMLTEASDRPLSLLRLPSGLGGEGFFQKHPGKGFPDQIKRVQVTESSGDAEPYGYVTDAAGLVAGAQMGTIEFHLWAARRDRLDRPDRMVFDLDPDEGLKFGDVRSAALDLRDRLADMGLKSWALMTGGKGVHVVVPLRRTVGWDTLKLFSHGVATMLANAEPDRFVAVMSKARRKDRIFVDYLRNERGATAISPFSVRAHAGAPVAVPVAWDALAKLRKAAPFGTVAALERGWNDVTPPAPQTLSSAVVRSLEDAMARN